MNQHHFVPVFFPFYILQIDIDILRPGTQYNSSNHTKPRKINTSDLVITHNPNYTLTTPTSLLPQSIPSKTPLVPLVDHQSNQFKWNSAIPLPFIYFMDMAFYGQSLSIFFYLSYLLVKSLFLRHEKIHNNGIIKMELLDKQHVVVQFSGYGNVTKCRIEDIELVRVSSTR